MKYRPAEANELFTQRKSEPTRKNPNSALARKTSYQKNFALLIQHFSLKAAKSQTHSSRFGS